MPDMGQGIYNNGKRDGLKQGLEQGLEQGLQQGKLDATIECCLKCINSGMSLDRVFSILEVDEDIKELVLKELNK